jgi:SAM-dependent methyltransferase
VTDSGEPLEQGGTAVAACRSCGSASLEPVLDLGSTPVANCLVSATESGSDPTYPLGLVFCPDCSLVQIAYELPADTIFRDDYPYYSSTSDAFVAHARRHVEQLVAERDLGARSFAVEVGSNDGYLLRNFLPHGVRVLGVDPSPGPASTAVERGVPSIVDFFGRATADRIVAEHGRADVIIANNVMAHVPDLDDFVGGFARLLCENGVLTVENPWVLDMVERCEFDTVYHEHYSYFSCAAVDRMMQRHGLWLNDVEYFPDIHGGTLRWYIGRHPARTARCEEALRREQAAGIVDGSALRGFADRVAACQTALRTMIAEIRAGGGTVAAYGAAAKGATMLNTTGIGHEQLLFVADRNPHKQSKLMPGCRVPVVPVERIAEVRPDYLLLLAWNFADEIISQQHDYVVSGGRFIVPIPTATVR